jgi:hypothetical protein
MDQLRLMVRASTQVQQVVPILSQEATHSPDLEQVDLADFRVVVESTSKTYLVPSQEEQQIAAETQYMWVTTST